MKCIYRSIVVVSSMVGVLFFIACDWSSGSQANFNTSNQSGLTNISGFYEGNISGGRAVSKIGPGNILSFTVQQSGNRLDVTDNQGSNYSGSVGAPQTLVAPNGAVPEGSVLSTYQVSFQGKDNVSGKDIEFSGVVGLITTRIIQGTVSGGQSSTTTSSSSSSSSSTTTTTTTGGSGSSSIDDSVAGQNNGTTYVTAEQNTQLRLQGTWIEIGGNVGSVDAIAAGVAGFIEFSSPAPNIPSPENATALPTPIPPLRPTPLPTPTP